MALGWRTYRSIPRLGNYAEAKRWHDDVAPIRGDEHGTRPVGRRDQKWFSIWMEGGTVHVGYGNGELSKRQTLVAYHPGGTIAIHRRNRWSSASTNERLGRLLGGNFRTHQYDMWVRCKWFDNGTVRSGYLPLKSNGERKWDATDAVSTFVRGEGGELVYLNYTYPVTHKPNKVRLKEALAPFVPFIQFVEGLRKLQGGDYLTFTQETRAEFFGWADGVDYRGQRRTNPVPNLHWGDDPETLRAQFFAWARSDDPDDRMRAAITMVNNNRQTTVYQFFTDMLLKADHSILDTEVHTDGRLVKDRYKRYLLK